MSRADVGDNWRFDSDGNDIDDALDARIAGGDDGPWVDDIHYTRQTIAADEDVLAQQHGVQHLYRYLNWDSDILAFINGTNVGGIAAMADVYGVELLPELALDPFPEVNLQTNASAHAIRVREFALVADGYDHNDAVFEDLNKTGNGTVIAILDSGVDNTHLALDDLDDNPVTTDDYKLVQKPGKNGTLFGGMQAMGNLTAKYCELDPVDNHGHGTAAAGIAMGTSGAGGLSGMAPGARLVDLSVFQTSNYTDLFSDLQLTGAVNLALDFVLAYNNGDSCYKVPGPDDIDVLSISMGIAKEDPTRGMPARISDIVRSGITVIMSAGNSGAGGLENVVEGGIMVGNANMSFTVDRSDDLLFWDSSRGPRSMSDGDSDETDELAPHVTAPGEYVLAPLAGSATGYRPFRGTSSAAPHVAGTAALMLEANPLLRPEDQGSLTAMGDAGAVPIRDLLIQTAQFKYLGEESPFDPPFAQPGPSVNETGMFNQTWNNGWGYGLIDSYGAVTAAQSYQP